MVYLNFIFYDTYPREHNGTEYLPVMPNRVMNTFRGIVIHSLMQNILISFVCS